MTEPFALTCHEVIKDFARTRAVDGLDLQVPAGRIFGLLGPNGSGKTTTIRICLGINEPDGGSVRILGHDDPREVRDRVGYLPEERGLYPRMKVVEQLAFLGAIRGMSHADATTEATSWLERLGLGDRADSNTNELSKGMQQKVQFAAAVIHEPELVVLDEPFSGLDPVNTRLLKEIVLQQVQRGTTVVLSTHRMDQVEQMCDSISLIHKGRAVVSGGLDEVKRSHGTDTVTLTYEGDPEGLRGLPGVREVRDSGRQARLVLESDTDPQSLLEELVQRLRIRSFAVEEPTIEDIFIDMVEEGAAALEAPAEVAGTALADGVSAGDEVAP